MWANITGRNIERLKGALTILAQFCLEGMWNWTKNLLRRLTHFWFLQVSLYNILRISFPGVSQKLNNQRFWTSLRYNAGLFYCLCCPDLNVSLRPQVSHVTLWVHCGKRNTLMFGHGLVILVFNQGHNTSNIPGIKPWYDKILYIRYAWICNYTQ